MTFTKLNIETTEKVISQLESLIEDRKSFLDGVDDEIYRDDI